MMNRHRNHLDDNSINGIDYMESAISMDPLQFHNEVCATAKSLRRTNLITDLSINPWFYLMPPKPRRVNKICGVGDLWKLYAASGEDTDSDESDDQFEVENVKNVKGGKKCISPSKNKASSAKSETAKGVLKEKEVIPTESFKNSKSPDCNKVQQLKNSLTVVNYAKQREENLYSLYGSEAYHIKAKEDWLDTIQMNYIRKFNPPYWPCEPLNHHYPYGHFNIHRNK